MSRTEPDPGAAIGKWMVFLAWILFLGLLTVFFDQYLEKKHNPNEQLQRSQNPDGSVQVSLTRNHYGHYVTSGLINSQPVTFLLDTGATQISIPDEVARDLGLRRGAPHPVVTANGTITVYDALLDSVAVGPLEIRGLRAGINPYMGGKEILLGMNFLKHWEMIQQGDQMILKSPARTM
ncbi:MAG: retropepsin-like aspartic protease family protein [Gammaproteobacteria bacterium]